jgi:hypothetical protein
MKRFPALLAALALLVAGCAGDKPSPAGGTLSEKTARKPFIRDLTALREAMQSDKGDEAVSGIYDLLDRATAEKDVGVGAQMIRRELPGLVATLVASAPKVRPRVRAVKLQTSSAEAVRALDIDVFDEDVEMFQAFQADVAARSPHTDTWLAVARWARRNNAVVNRVGARLKRIMRGLRPEDRDALVKAFREASGTPLK